MNILTRKENLTEKSIAAAKGEYYSSKLPIISKGPKTVGPGKKIADISDYLQTEVLSSYDGNGKDVGNRARIFELVDRCYHEDKTPIV